jgi:hypothetical protein
MDSLLNSTKCLKNNTNAHKTIPYNRKESNANRTSCEASTLIAKITISDFKLNYRAIVKTQYGASIKTDTYNNNRGSRNKPTQLKPSDSDREVKKCMMGKRQIL